MSSKITSKKSQSKVPSPPPEPKPKMLRQRDIARLKPKHDAAKKIQAVWRGHKERKHYEQLLWQEMCERDRDNDEIGCMCGDWLCPGCGQGPPIRCVMCGRDCRGGDYEDMGLCSRRCMVRCGAY